MHNFLIFFVLIFFFIACNNEEQIIKRYENGNIKSVHYIGENKMIDSSYLYYPTKELKQIVYFNDKDSLSFTELYNRKGYKLSEGSIVKNKLDFKIGKWKKYGNEVDSIIEYINLNNKSYVNQIWVLDRKTKDTLKDKGNFYEIYVKDTISIYDTLQIRFYQYLPALGYDSDIEVVKPSIEADLKKDFSNFNSIERDTFFSLKNDGIPHPEIPNDIPINHYVEFGIIYNQPGIKKVSGYITEYIIIKKDTTERIERRLYFNENVFVKDTLN